MNCLEFGATVTQCSIISQLHQTTLCIFKSCYQIKHDQTKHLNISKFYGTKTDPTSYVSHFVHIFSHLKLIPFDMSLSPGGVDVSLVWGLRANDAMPLLGQPAKAWHFEVRGNVAAVKMSSRRHPKKWIFLLAQAIQVGYIYQH